MIWIPVFLMIATLALAELQRYGSAPFMGWLPRVLPFAFAASAVWFIAMVFLTVDMKEALLAVIGAAKTLDERHSSLVTALFALFGAVFACVGFARVAWNISETLCEPPENAYQFSIAGPAALGLLGVALLALTYTRL
jgi:hypothetical protein